MKERPILSSGQEITTLNIGDVSVLPNRVRPTNEAKVEELAKSMAEVGMIEPIIVCRNGPGFNLVSGFHRLTAAQKLGWQCVDSIIIEVSQPEARLVEIDENIVRNELTAAERALCMAERQKMYEECYPETKKGGDRKCRSKRQLGASIKSFAEETSKKTGQSKRAVQRDAARGKKVKVLSKIIGTCLDTGSEIDALAKLQESEQRVLAEAAQRGEQVTARVKEPASSADDNEDDSAVVAWDRWNRPQRVLLMSKRRDQILQLLEELSEKCTKGEAPEQVQPEETILLPDRMKSMLMDIAIYAVEREGRVDPNDSKWRLLVLQARAMLEFKASATGLLPVAREQ
jgi:ParB family chromosome partitioning protein